MKKKERPAIDNPLASIGLDQIVRGIDVYKRQALNLHDFYIKNNYGELYIKSCGCLPDKPSIRNQT